MNIIKIETTCPFCGKKQIVTVKSEDYDKWKNGEFIQTAFPYLTPSEREALITGICDDCWPD
jgi:hypothetical protein